MKDIIEGLKNKLFAEKAAADNAISNIEMCNRHLRELQGNISSLERAIKVLEVIWKI